METQDQIQDSKQKVIMLLTSLGTFVGKITTIIDDDENEVDSALQDVAQLIPIMDKAGQQSLTFVKLGNNLCYNDATQVVEVEIDKASPIYQEYVKVQTGLAVVQNIPSGRVYK